MKYYEMSKDDFKKGQIVYLMGINDTIRSLPKGVPEIIKTGVVTKIGLEYVYVKKRKW